MKKNILGLFDGSDIEGISALIGKLEESSFDYLRLEGDGIKIVIGKNGMIEGAEAATVREERPVFVAAVNKEHVERLPEQVADVESALSLAGVVQEEAVSVITSPSYGLFYAQPEPGAPPYVKKGDMVKVGDTVGLLEIMKTFHAIASAFTGEVLRIHVKNEDVLEPDQPLFTIRTA